MFYLDIVVKLAMAFIFAIIVFRVTGQTTLAQMSALSILGNVILGGVISGVIYTPTITIPGFFLILLIWTVMMLAVEFLRKNSVEAKKMIVGNPIAIIQNGKLVVSALSQAEMDVTDLETLLHMKGIKSMTEIQTAQLEPNGQLSVIRKGEPDFGYIIIKNGEFIEDALQQIHKSKAWVKERLAKEGYTDLRSIFCAEFYNNHITVTSNAEVKKTVLNIKNQQQKQAANNTPVKKTVRATKAKVEVKTKKAK